MGKKSRKAKAKTKDFQKTKLKVGKRKPLPNNVTEVAFKSRSIYVAEQLTNVAVDQGDEGNVTTLKRKIPEFLNQVSHFNANFRSEALASLRTSFASEKGLVGNHLPKVFAKVPRLLFDEDQQVRKSSVAFFKFLFSELSDQEMAPFFDVVLNNLFCAMNHYYDDVQRDSMQIVDLFIEHFPNLFTAKSRDALLERFIGLISTKRTSSISNSNSAETRVLSMKLSSKESSVVWRNRVLKRLSDLLAVTPEPHGDSTENRKWELVLLHISDSSLYSFSPEVCGKLDSEEYRSCLVDYESRSFFRPGLSLRSLLNTEAIFKSLENKTSSPQQLVMTLVPLLIDSWHEAMSDEMKMFTEDVLATMTHVLNITNILLKKFIATSEVKIDSIRQVRKRFHSDFEKYFFDVFPLSRTRGSAGRKGSLTRDFSSTIHGINLTICELATILYPKQLIGEDASLLGSVAEYISMLVASESSNAENCDSTRTLDDNTLRQCIVVVKSLLDAAMDEDTVESLLQPLVVLFHCLETRSQKKKKILIFLSYLYSDFDFPSNLVLDEWACSLPLFLAEIMQSKAKDGRSICSDYQCLDTCLIAMSTMRLALVKEKHDFACELGEKSELMLEIAVSNAEDLFSSNATDCGKIATFSESGDCAHFMTRFLTILLHPALETGVNNVVTMSQLCHTNYVPAESANLAASLFVGRCKNLMDFTTAVAFICSLLIGHSQEVLRLLQSDSDEIRFHRIVDTGPDHRPVQQHADIVDNVCALLRTLPQTFGRLRRFFTEELLEKFNVMPTICAYSILKCSVLLGLTDDATASIYEQLEDPPLANFRSSLGKFVASTLVCCHGNANSSETAVIVDACNSALAKSVEVMRACLEEFSRPEHCENWGVVCKIIDDMLSQTELHDNLTVCRDAIDDVLRVIVNSKDDVISHSVIESIMFNVSAVLPLVT